MHSIRTLHPAARPAPDRRRLSTSPLPYPYGRAHQLHGVTFGGQGLEGALVPAHKQAAEVVAWQGCWAAAGLTAGRQRLRRSGSA